LTAKRLATGTVRERAPKRVFANYELVVLATYLAGGQSAAVDTEDIAVKADELAPGRFSWRKYKNQISINTVSKRLWDATKAERGAYLIGSEKTGWRLTKAGFDFAQRNMKDGGPPRIAVHRKSQSERVSQNREIRRMTHEDAFLKFAKGMTQDISKSDVERFFRLDDYVTGKLRTAKIERFKIIANNNQDLSLAIDFLAKLVKEG
jgi:hypothetical protein